MKHRNPPQLSLKPSDTTTVPLSFDELYGLDAEQRLQLFPYSMQGRKIRGDGTQEALWVVMRSRVFGYTYQSDTEPIRKWSEGRARLSARLLCEYQSMLQDTYGFPSQDFSNGNLVSWA